MQLRSGFTYTYSEAPAAPSATPATPRNSNKAHTIALTSTFALIFVATILSRGPGTSPIQSHDLLPQSAPVSNIVDTAELVVPVAKTYPLVAVSTPLAGQCAHVAIPVPAVAYPVATVPVSTGKCSNDAHVSQDAIAAFWFVVYIIVAVACASIQEQKVDAYDGTADFDRGYYEGIITMLATNSNMLQPVRIKTSDPVLDREYYESIISELAKRSSDLIPARHVSFDTILSMN